MTPLLYTIVVLLLLVIILQILLLRKRHHVDLPPDHQIFLAIEKSSERAERTVREEIGKNREEAYTAFRQSREEVAGAIKAGIDTLNQQMANLTAANEQK